MRLAAKRGSGRQDITSDSSEIDVTRTSFQSKNVCTKRREGLFGRLVSGVFQAAGEDQMLHHRPPGIGRGGLVVLLEDLVKLCELCRATDCCHGVELHSKNYMMPLYIARREYAAGRRCAHRTSCPLSFDDGAGNVPVSLPGVFTRDQNIYYLPSSKLRSSSASAGWSSSAGGSTSRRIWAISIERFTP